MRVSAERVIGYKQRTRRTRLVSDAAVVITAARTNGRARQDQDAYYNRCRRCEACFTDWTAAWQSSLRLQWCTAQWQQRTTTVHIRQYTARDCYFEHYQSAFEDHSANVVSCMLRRRANSFQHASRRTRWCANRRWSQKHNLKLKVV